MKKSKTTSIDIKQARDEAWRRGYLRWKLHSGQKKIYNAIMAVVTQFFLCNCSRQWGKSYLASVIALEMALSKPNSQIRYGAAFQTDLLDYIIPKFQEIMDDCPEDIKGKYNSQQSAFLFPNGSKIKIIGLDKNPDGMRGNTLDLIIVDEAAYVADLEYLYKSVIVPATTHRPEAKILFISSAPSTPDHAFQDYANKAKKEGAYAVFTIYDNPMVSPETIWRLMEEAGGEDSTTWRREYLCEFVTDANKAIIPEWKDGYVCEIPTDEFYPLYHRYVSQDLGVKDFTALLFAYYDFKKATLVIQDELHMNGPELITPTLVESIKAKEKELWGETKPYRRVSDNNNLQLLQDMSSLHNFHFMATNKDTLEAMINEVRWMVKQGRIRVHPRCENLIWCLKYGIWDSKRKAFNRSKEHGHYDHLAALVYMVRNLSTSINPIPADFGFQSHTAWLHNIKDESSNAAKLAKSFEAKPKLMLPKTFTHTHKRR